MPTVFLHPATTGGRTYLAPLAPPAAAQPAPSGAVTSQPVPDGQSQRFVLTTANATGGSMLLDGVTDFGPVAFTITNNAANFTITGIPAGTYTPVPTLTGPGGTATATGAQPITINGVSGGGGVGEEPPPAEVDDAPRFARPMRDVSKGAWQPSIGTDLYAMLDEATLDLGDFMTASTAALCEIALGPVADPGTSSGQVVRYEAHAPDGGNLTVTLKQGNIVIASRIHAALPVLPTMHELALTPQQCDSITDYRDLRVEFEVIEVEVT